MLKNNRRKNITKRAAKPAEANKSSAKGKPPAKKEEKIAVKKDEPKVLAQACAVGEVVKECSTKPYDGREDATFNSIMLKQIAKLVVLDLNDAKGFIPDVDLSPGMFYAYLKRIISWHVYKCNMINQLPTRNCDAYSVPVWVANWIEAFVPYMAPDGVKIVLHINDLEESSFLSESVEPALTSAGGCMTPLSSLQNVEKTFIQGTNFTISSVSSETFESISRLLASTVPVVRVLKLAKTTSDGAHYLGPSFTCLSPTYGMARSLSPVSMATAFDNYFSPQLAFSSGMPTSVDFAILGLFSKCCQQHGMTPRQALKKAKYATSDTLIVGYTLDFAHIGTLCHQLLLSLGMGSETDYQNIWFQFFILQVTRYLYSCPAWMLASQTSDDYAYYKTPQHAQIPTLPIFNDLQPCGQFPQLGVKLVFPRWDPAVPFPSNAFEFDVASLYGNAPSQSRVTFTTAPVYLMNVAVTNINVTPICTLNELLKAFKPTSIKLGLTTLSIPRAHYYASTQVDLVEQDNGPVGTWTAQYVRTRQLGTPGSVSPQQCFLQTSGCLIRTANKQRFMEFFHGGDSQQLGIAEVAVPSESEVIAAGQKANVGAATDAVYKNKILAVKNGVAIDSPSYLDAVLRFAGDAFIPDAQQIKRLVLGKMGYDEALAYGAGWIFDKGLKHVKKEIGGIMRFSSLRLPSGSLSLMNG